MERLRGAVARAVETGVADPNAPLRFGLQPVLQTSLVLTDDQRIQTLNRDYRGQDKPTDVLSFSQLEGDVKLAAPPSGSLLLGDIVISVETARRQARSSLDDELCHLAVHGALHLLGYDHQTDAEEAHMNSLAQAALKNGAPSSR